jgi:hypothetical protein
MWTVSACIYGESGRAPFTRFPNTILRRANRAQYGEVSFKIIPDDETAEIALPSLQGLAEDEGEVM